MIPFREIDTDFHLTIALEGETDVADAGSHVFIVYPVAGLGSRLFHPIISNHDCCLFCRLPEISCESIPRMQNGIIAAESFEAVLYNVGGKIRPVPFITQVRGVARRAWAFLCPYHLLPRLLDETAINIPIDDGVKVDASSLPSSNDIDRFEFFSRFLVKPGKFSLEATKVPPDFRRRLVKRLRRIGKTHPVITRLEILLQQKQTLLLCALILPSSHLLLGRLFADPLPISLPIPP